MKTPWIFLIPFLILILAKIVPVHLQDITSRHYRPLPDKCDRHGRCSPKEGYSEAVERGDGYKSEKERPPELTRDDWPVRPLADDDYKKEEDKIDSTRRPVSGGGYGSSYKPDPVVVKEGDKTSGGRPIRGGGYGGSYNPKPAVDRDDDKISGERPIGGGGYGGSYNPKATVDKDDDKISGGRPIAAGGYAGSYDPKPTIDKDDDKIREVRPGSSGGYGGGYNPKPTIDRDDEKTSAGRPGSGGYNSKPSGVRDDDDLKSSGGGRPSSGGYGGSYDSKPPLVRDDDDKRGGRPSGGSGGYRGSGYNPKPVVDKDDDLKPVIGRPITSGSGYGGSGYNPKPDVTRDTVKPAIDRPVSAGGGYGGGYNPKPVVDRDDYNPKPGGIRGGYNPKPVDDDYNIKPARGGGGYYPDDGKLDKDDLGGYNKPKDDDYNDYGIVDDKKDEDYDGKPIPVVEGNCICVPYYQCKDGHIVTDGEGIIDARKRPDPEGELPLDGKFKPPSCGPYHVCCNTPESSTVKPYEHRCGVRNPSGINSRILSPSNKGEADFGEWPWQAAVLKSEGKVNIFQCGGVLIDKYHVLTVAHCVFHLYQLNDYPLKVRLGEWDTQTTTEFLAHEDYKVSKILIHPEYRNSSLWNDVAVLRLQDPVLFAPHIDTVCLPQYDEVFSDQNCVVTGWGKDAYKGGTFSNVMKEVALQVIDNYKCEEMLRKTRLGRFFQLHEGFLCAGGEYGLDSCKGDGGGPLVCYRKDKSYALAGIVSWGIDCGQPGVPGVYVKIQKYLDWISKTTGVTLQEYWPKH